MGYNLLVNGVYWGYNPLIYLLLTSWDIQVYIYVYIYMYIYGSNGNIETKTHVSSNSP